MAVGGIDGCCRGKLEDGPVSKCQIQLLKGRMSGLTRDGTAEPVSRDYLRRERHSLFSRPRALFIGNHACLVRTLLNVLTIHAYMSTTVTTVGTLMVGVGKDK